jgi:hypothetical protein
MKNSLSALRERMYRSGAKTGAKQRPQGAAMRCRLGIAGLAYALALFSGASLTSIAKAAAPQKACDYACLTGIVDQYLKALLAHDAKQIQVTEHVKFTENSIPLKLGDALWGTISGLGTYKLYMADPEGGTAGIEQSVRENGTLAILFVRLKVVDRKISEIETLVHRNADDAKALEKMGQPNPVWTQSLEPTQQVPREQMKKIADSYFEGILHSSGDSVPFDLRCNRVLDGFQDTNNPAVSNGWFDKGSFHPDAMDIRDNMNQHIWTYIHSIDPRRFVLIDQKIGIVLVMAMYNHTGTVEFADVPGVGKIPMPAVARHPSTLDAAEFFKIEGGKIRQVEGVTVGLPFGAPTGW